MTHDQLIARLEAMTEEMRELARKNEQLLGLLREKREDPKREDRMDEIQKAMAEARKIETSRRLRGVRDYAS